MFKVGDIVRTVVEEYDIEHIPAGTEITLSKKNSSQYWYGYATLNGHERIVLITTDNLEYKTVK